MIRLLIKPFFQTLSHRWACDLVISANHLGNAELSFASECVGHFWIHCSEIRCTSQEYDYTPTLMQKEIQAWEFSLIFCIVLRFPFSSLSPKWSQEIIQPAEPSSAWHLLIRSFVFCSMDQSGQDVRQNLLWRLLSALQYLFSLLSQSPVNYFVLYTVLSAVLINWAALTYRSPLFAWKFTREILPPLFPFLLHCSWNPSPHLLPAQIMNVSSVLVLSLKGRLWVQQSSSLASSP